MTSAGHAFAFHLPTCRFLQHAGTVKNVVRADVQMMRQQRQQELEAKQQELEAQVEGLERQLRDIELEKQQQQQQQQQQKQPSPAAQQQEAAAAAAAAEAAAAAAAAAEERAAVLTAELASLRKDLMVQRDRADAFEQLLKQAAAAEAAAAAAAAGAAVANANAFPAPVGAALAATPATAPRPSPAFLAASPLLSASRGVAEWVADAAAAEAATPVGQQLPLLQLLPGTQAICCLLESHMQPDELAPLQVKAGGHRPPAWLPARLPACCSGLLCAIAGANRPTECTAAMVPDLARF